MADTIFNKVDFGKYRIKVQIINFVKEDIPLFANIFFNTYSNYKFFEDVVMTKDGGITLTGYGLVDVDTKLDNVSVSLNAFIDDVANTIRSAHIQSGVPLPDMTIVCEPMFTSPIISKNGF